MHELVVDNFAGGGGASTGIRAALGREVDIAINHDPDAIAMHKANHPNAFHYCEDVWAVDPIQACQGRPVGLAWFSPDCKHFSKAKGGKPVEKKIRGLAWVAVRWAKKVRPRVIMLENVEEFVTWGPVKDGQPVKELAGTTFEHFVKQLNKLGYKVDWRELRACDYGAPTTRKRFFLIARCDGLPIIWPNPTHGDPEGIEVRTGLLKPWRTAAEIIDWALPCPSIFATSEDIMRDYGVRAVRPLSEKTMKRIARGIQKFVMDNPEPFIVHYKYENEPESINKPLSTVTSVNGHYLAMPTLIQYHDSPEARGQTLDKPIMTVDAANRYGLVTAFIHKYYDGGYTGAGSAIPDPLATVTSRDHNSLCTAFITKMKGQNIGQDARDPLQTITAGGLHYGEVRAFLLKYYGTGEGAELTVPIHTVTARDRFGLVMVRGEAYQIADIGLRMLVPRELFNGQGFPPDYIIDVDADGKAYPRSAQVARAGNAVCPSLAEALVKANVPEMCKEVAA